ncbi:venom protease-like [Calliphora vicina]|uniref:venom protease-like n=1 Tax=Calliphora vicina TaxID=7373 RepID=UPI00325ADAEB
MQNSFKNKQIQLKFCFFSLLIGAVEMQENDFKCSKYKQLVFEETKTFSYYLPGANELSFTEDHCSTSEGFVVGGENARPKEFAFAARLGHMADNGYVNWFCGGTLLSESVVLTAAHCFYASLGEVNRVRLGELDFDTDSDDAEPEDFNVQKLIEHPDYIYGEPYNDIGLVMLSSTVKFDRYKHPACLPISSSLQNSDYFIAIGWGHIKFSGKSPSDLQKVTLRSYSYAKCQWLAEGPEGKERLPGGLKYSQLCAGSTEEKDTCQGDSGGPLLAQHTKYPCMFSVVGITSLGVGGCAIPNVPAIYTNVNFYLDWISKYVY